MKTVIAIITGIIIMQILQYKSQVTLTSGKSWISDQVRSDMAVALPHHSTTGGRFAGPSIEMKLSISDFICNAWNYLSNANRGAPLVALPVKPVNLSRFVHPGSDQLNVTWLGHSSLMINLDGYRVLTDPVFEKRITWLGPTRFNGDVPLDIHQVPPVDIVIISHDHYDHLNKLSVQLLNDKTSRFVVPLAVGARLSNWGIPKEKIVELGWWEEYRFDENLTIAATPAQHFSGRGMTDRNRTLWASWVLCSPFHKIFFSGDSGYFDGFKQIGERYGPFDMTFIECGAYNEAWPQVHMFPEETVRAHLDLEGNILHPIHWGTFKLALHPWYEPMERLAAAASTAGIGITTPIVGETTVARTHIPVKKWWRQAMTSYLEMVTP